MNLKATEVFEWNYNCNSEVVVNVGGARSSKSFSLAQLFIIKLLTESNKRFLILRKTLPSMRISTYKLIVDLLSEYGVYNPASHNKTARTYVHRNNFVHFTGLDDPQKIKSTEWNYVWMEEANEFTWEDFITLKTRMSAKSYDGKQNQMFLSLNPCDEGNWVYQKVIKSKGRKVERSKSNIAVFKSNYLNNPFLSTEYVNSLVALKEEDETYYKIYTLGEWSLPKNLIYNNWEITENFPGNFDEVIYGLDFGFNNPTALIKIGYYDGNIYLKQLIYETKLTNELLIARMRQVVNAEMSPPSPPSKGEHKYDFIYADCAEPQRIEEIYRAGFNIHPAEKSVRDGIDFVKRRKLSVHSDSGDLIDELKKYKWKEDRDGNILDEPVKFMDHAMDAMRYGIYSHSRKRGELKLAFV
jgi:phage terminase large subunit